MQTPYEMLDDAYVALQAKTKALESRHRKVLKERRDALDSVENYRNALAHLKNRFDRREELLALLLSDAELEVIKTMWQDGMSVPEALDVARLV